MLLVTCLLRKQGNLHSEIVIHRQYLFGLLTARKLGPWVSFVNALVTLHLLYK